MNNTRGRIIAGNETYGRNPNLRLESPFRQNNNTDQTITRQNDGLFTPQRVETPPGNYSHTGNSSYFTTPDSTNVKIPIFSSNHQPNNSLLMGQPQGGAQDPSSLSSFNVIPSPQDGNKSPSNVTFDNEVYVHRFNTKDKNANTIKKESKSHHYVDHLPRANTVSSFGDFTTPTQKLESILERLETVLVNLLESIRR